MIDIGFLIATSASIIALYGVYQFNQRKDYTGARLTWAVSNPLFLLYFMGRIFTLWNGGLGDWATAAYFAGMTVSNYWGLTQYVR